MLGNKAGPVRLEEGQEALEPAGLSQRDVDEVDPAAVLRLVPSLDGDLARDRFRRVGDEQEVVGRRRRGDEDEQREQGRAGEEERRGGETRADHRLEHGRGQRSERVSPPSTGITAPVTYDARSEARNAATAPISAAVPRRPSGIRWSAFGGGAILSVQLAHAFGVDLAGRDRVDGDPVRSELARQGLEPADHPGPYRVREREPVDGLADGRRLDRDDAPVPARAEMRQAMADERHVRGEQERHRLLDRGRGQRRRLGGGRTAAVEHDDVERAEGADRRLDEPFEVLGDPEVSLHRERADAVGLSLEHLAAAGEHRDVRALPRERLGDREAHAGRAAADDRRAPLEPQFHGAKATRGVVQPR